MAERYFHGGAPGLRPGDLIEPQQGTAHLLDGCPTCEARKAGQPLANDDNDPNLVYDCQGRWNRETGDALMANQIVVSNDNYFTVRSWMAVLTYLLMDYRFLYE